MDNRFLALIDNSIVYRTMSYIFYFVFLVFHITVPDQTPVFPSPYLLLVVILFEIIFVVAAQEVDHQDKEVIDVLVDTILAFVPTLVVMREIWGWSKRQRARKQDILFYTGPLLIALILGFFSLIFIIQIFLVIIYVPTWRLFYLLIFNVVGYLGIPVGLLLTQMQEKTSETPSIREKLLVNIFGPLVAGESKRFWFFMISMLVLILLLVFSGYITSLVI